MWGFLVGAKHCVEVEQHIKLVVLSEGRETPTSELMHLALRSLNRILELGYEFQQRQRMKTVAEEIPRRTHMAVRGAMGQASAHAQINGNYRPVPGEVCMCNEEGDTNRDTALVVLPHILPILTLGYHLAYSFLQPVCCAVLLSVVECRTGNAFLDTCCTANSCFLYFLLYFVSSAAHP